MEMSNDENPIIVEIEVMHEDEQTSKKPTGNIKDLLTQFNQVKTASNIATDGLTKGFTLKGMDSVNELVSDAMKKIDDFTSNGEEQGFFGKATSKTLALVGAKNSWLGKWADKKSDEQRTEELNSMTINEIVNELVANVNTKREEVIEFTQHAVEIKKDMVSNIDIYETLLIEAELLLTHAAAYSKEMFDGQQLVQMLIATVESLKTSIKSQVDPLIVSASMSVEKIGALLPTIENELKYTTGFKAFQQKLSDLNGMVEAVTNLTTTAGDVIRKDINEAVYESIALVGKSGIDVKRLRKINQEETAHQKKINEVVNKTQNEFNDTFKEMKALQLEQQTNRSETTNLLIENYSESTMQQ